MRTTVEKAIDNLIRQDVPIEDIIKYLAANLTSTELTEELASALKENRKLKDSIPPMVRITQEDFNKHFRIIGTRPDGTKENRGRPWNK